MATKPVKVPAYRVQISQQGAVVADKTFDAGPGNDASTVNYKYGGNEWTHIFVRQKTQEGDMFITARYQGQHMQHVSVDPEHPAQIRQADGNVFDITVTRIEGARELSPGEVVAFDPPRATITADAGGWRITYEPKQYPCVLTVALEDAITKDEALPSFPFPSNPRFSRASFYIPNGQFAAKAGGELRLGVRGAGREARVKLPKPGESVTVEPKQFQVKGPSQPDLLTEQYVASKYGEKAGLLSYEP
ncbi:MAG: hypothetical protein IPJ65_40515 [Archangiaceae bacterium]|nr:hypothetical protein [Archangiaceae bacterium]